MDINYYKYNNDNKYNNGYNFNMYMNESYTILKFIKNNENISYITTILDNIDENIIEIYLREKKIKRIKNNIK